MKISVVTPLQNGSVHESHVAQRKVSPFQQFRRILRRKQRSEPDIMDPRMYSSDRAMDYRKIRSENRLRSQDSSCDDDISL